MRTWRRWAVLAIVMGLPGLSNAAGQTRRLGPDTARSILDARVDPAFQTTKLDRVAVAPIANTIQFRDGARLVSKSLVAQLAQLQPNVKLVPPDELMNFVSSSKMDDAFNVFLGDYLEGSVRPDFLGALKLKLQVDAVLLGRMTAYAGVAIDPSKCGRGGRDVGLQMGLYRVSDARRIWYGEDCITALRVDDLQDAAGVIGEVFARFFGRLPY